MLISSFNSLVKEGIISAGRSVCEFAEHPRDESHCDKTFTLNVNRCWALLKKCRQGANGFCYLDHEIMQHSTALLSTSKLFHSSLSGVIDNYLSTGLCYFVMVLLAWCTISLYDMDRAWLLVIVMGELKYQ